MSQDQVFLQLDAPEIEYAMLQAQFFGGSSEYGAEVMVCQYDHTVEDYLKHVGVPYDRQERVMRVPFRHAEHSH